MVVLNSGYWYENYGFLFYTSKSPQALAKNTNVVTAVHSNAITLLNKANILVYV